MRLLPVLAAAILLAFPAPVLAADLSRESRVESRASPLPVGSATAFARPADRQARVDAEGVLRWTDNGAEVALLRGMLTTFETPRRRG